jgi:hypothetical protein
MVEIVGKGTYGCVAKPSLQCTTNESYHGRVSKLMAKDDAKEEYNEMVRIANIPGIEEYAMRKPVLCAPQKDDKLKTALRKCDNERVQYARGHTDGLRLLLLDDGGVDLEKMVNNVVSTLSPSDISIFLTSLLKLIRGVDFFRKHNLIHHDIKLPNIVYNVSTGQIKYIDFGLAMKYDDFIKSSSGNTNDMAQSWDYFPLEYSCANREDYELLEKCKKYHSYKYDDFIKRAANTFDSYCLAYCLSDLFKHMARRLPNLKQAFVDKSLRLFSEYSEKELQKRNDDLVSFETRYKALLREYNLYNDQSPTPSKKSIDLAEKYSVSKTTQREEEEREKSRPHPASAVAVKQKKSRTRARKPRKRTQKPRKLPPCPPGKLRNSATNRCKKIKCPRGTKMSPTSGMCRTVRCPPGKARNPASGRCKKTRRQPKKK